MSDGTHHNERQMYQAIQYLSDCIEALQFAPAGLSLPAPAARPILLNPLLGYESRTIERAARGTETGIPSHS